MPSGTPQSQGRTQDGQAHYAGQFAPETGNYLYYTCDASGTQNLLLAGGTEGPAAVLTPDVDGQVLGLWFEASDGGNTARLDLGSRVPCLLVGARRLDLHNEAGWSLGLFGMAGAVAAIGGARAACGL